MTTVWRRAMVYLGLGPDDEYDDYAARGDLTDSGVEPIAPVGRPAAVRPAPASPAPRPAAQAPIYSTPPDPVEGTSVRPVPISGDDASKPRVRAVPQRSNARAHLVTPTSFGMVQEVADKFKAGQAVAVDMARADRELSRRLIDFLSGMCYGIGGEMEKIGNGLFLLSPVGVEVPADERRRLVSDVVGD
jgi:cell division inhibitor SepF